MQSVTIGENQAGQRLDKFLRKFMPEAGTGFLYKMLRKKNITLNGKKAEGSELLAMGDQVCFFFSDATFAKFTGNNGKADSQESALRMYHAAYRKLSGIDVRYEDDHVLVLDKPAGILTQKAESDDFSLNEWMIGYLLSKNPRIAEEMGTFRPSVCNRLDRNTSGLVLCGKSLPGLQFLSRCIRERSVRKFYRTICLGQLHEPAQVKGYLSKDAGRNRVNVLNMDLLQTGSTANGAGDYIETAYRPLCVWERYTLLEVELITGKPHQIRAHLASIGHPLIGDFKYGDKTENNRFKQAFGLEHQLLHAFRVEFPEIHETAGAALNGRVITAPCPELFQRIQSTLGLDEPLSIETSGTETLG